MTNQEIYNELTANEKKVYDFCIKMGDTHSQAMLCVKIERHKQARFNSTEWQDTHRAMTD